MRLPSGDVGVIANCIFKYGPTKDAKRTFENLTLGFSMLSDFNDPYETEFRIVHYFHSVADSQELIDPPSVNPIKRIQALSDAFLNSLRVTCFSGTPSNCLMWSHYGDHHKGICYCFESPDRAKIFGDRAIEWGQVVYSSRVPEIKVFQDQTTEGVLTALLSDVVLTKSQDWAYERELRFFSKSSSSAIEFNPATLKAIILGRKISEDDKSMIRNLVQQYNINHGTGVEVLYAHRHPSLYDTGITSHENWHRGGESSLSASIPVLDQIRTPLVTPCT